MMDPNAAPREIELPINNVRQLIDCRVALKLADLRGVVRTIDDCVIAFLTVGRRRWEGLQVLVHHTGTPGVIDLGAPVPEAFKSQLAAMFAGGHSHSEVVELGLITKIQVGMPNPSPEDRALAFLECTGAHPYAHFPGEVCPIHFGDEPDQPSVAGFAEEATDDV